MHPLIEAHQISKRYGKGTSAFMALKGLDITIEQGEVVAVLGKSGSGKSTLMHLLALLDSPSEGTMSVNGAKVLSLSKREINALRNKEFGFVFQQFFLNGDETVLNNVILPLKIAGVPVRERKRRGLEVLKSVELDDKAANKAKDLSGGQKQRVCIARAIINNPKAIFADEPTGNLDSITGKKIENLLFDLHKDRNITLIFVTHDQDLAERCKRRVHIRDGRIVRGGNK